MSGLDKPSINVSWISPPIGTGAITIGYATCGLTKLDCMLYDNNMYFQVCSGANKDGVLGKPKNYRDI